jgi:hypothetical protein
MEHHMAIEKDLLDQLLAGRDPKDVFNKDGLVDELKKARSRAKDRFGPFRRSWAWGRYDTLIRDFRLLGP